MALRFELTITKNDALEMTHIETIKRGDVDGG